MSFKRSVALSLVTLLCCADRLLAGPTLLYDPANDKVLYSEEPDRLWHPASVTKIMTAYVTFDAIKAGKLALDTKIPYSSLAQKMPASKIGLAVGSEVTVDFALRAVIIKSANDISVALAEAVGGSHDGFVKRMNETAKRLGMSRTKYVNPNGLPAPEQVTTARDLGRLARAIINDYPQYAHYWTMATMRVGKRRLRSHNSLLRTFSGADGIKTGFICDSGYNVVASAQRDGLRLIAVVLGERSAGARAQRAANLLEHGFGTHGWKLFFEARSLEDLPPSTESMATTSIRRAVCNRPRVRRRKKRRRRKSATARKKTASASARKSSKRK
ncbi:MAG: D-alanyl-D-alanine carboxypeptidase family protein [Hyphomicrobiaceae bacterium]